MTTSGWLVVAYTWIVGSALLGGVCASMFLIG